MRHADAAQMAQDSGAAQYDDPIAQWWPAYLATTLTGWTLNAITSCYCDKCRCHFRSSFSALQHLRDSHKHMATVEALEAKCALYAYESAHIAQWGYSYEAYYGTDGQEAAEGEQPCGSADGSSSPTQGLAAPASEVFTASSEASDEHLLAQQQQRRSYQHQHGKRNEQRGGKPSWHSRSGLHPAASAQTRPQESYDSAFPTLGPNATAAAAPVRRWTPAAATRKLRVDAPEWAPGAPTERFASLTLKAKQAAAAVAAAGAAAASVEREHGDTADRSSDAPPAKERKAQRGKEKRQHRPEACEPVQASSEMAEGAAAKTWRNILLAGQ